jgi:hypothetical protein
MWMYVMHILAWPVSTQRRYFIRAPSAAIYCKEQFSTEKAM